MRYVYLLVLSLGIVTAQNSAPPDGATLYKERCATCHDAPEGRVPALATLKTMTGEAIYNALANGAMKSQAAGLSTIQIIQVIGFIGPQSASQAPLSLEKTCKGDVPFDPGAGPSWLGWSPTVANTRYQDAKAAGLTAGSVPQLKLKWAFNLGAVAVTRAQPVIAGGRVFTTSGTGGVYSLDAATGCTHWGFKAAVGPRAGVTLGDAAGVPAIFFSDGSATIYALNASTGKQIWQMKPAGQHWATVATAGPAFYKGVVYQPFSSIEEAIAADPGTPCCSFRGSVVAVDAATGKQLWQTFTIAEAAKSGTTGPSGAGIWSSPTIDEKLGALYVATGDNYSAPITETSDAILAMDLKTGKLLWSKQLTEGDAYNLGCTTPAKTHCPESEGPDFDFGQPPILATLANGHRALVIGQKSGMAHALDPDNAGKILWQTRAGAGSALGGSQWGSAFDGRYAYVAISDVALSGAPDASAPGGFRLTLDPKKGGGLHAINVATGEIAWSAKPVPCASTQPICSPAQPAAVTAISGAVFSGALDGHLRAYSSETGKVLWDVDTVREYPTVNGPPARGGSLDVAGPAVVGGVVYVNSGYAQWGGIPGNVLLAFSVDGK